MENLLELVDISKDFRGTSIISRVNLKVRKGEKHALIGPNGAGKTTLFNLITGKHSPSSGKILFNQERIDKYPIYKRSQNGIVRSFQVTNIFGDMSVYENIRNAIVSKHRYNMKMFRILNNLVEIEKEVEYWLNRIDLHSMGAKKAGVLSYGQQRALEIGLAMALNPELLLLDEPTAGMSSEETRLTVDLIKNLTKEKTLLIVEHDMEVVFDLADCISVLHYGEIIATDSPADIKQNEQVKEIYLGGVFE